MLLDFSAKDELRPLAALVRDLGSTASALGIPFFLMGAAARDIRLRCQHGIQGLRATEDVDVAIAVDGWPAFTRLRDGLVHCRLFVADERKAAHRLVHRTGTPIDIVPFGEIEQVDRTIAWPPRGEECFDCFGLAEALATCEVVRLPAGATIRVPSIPALALMKITAWRDRQLTHPGRDAPDLLRYFRHYAECGNLDRILASPDLVNRPDYDHDEAGVRLLARDVVALIDDSARVRLSSIVGPEADAQGTLRMARQSGMVLERARRLIEVFAAELA